VFDHVTIRVADRDASLRFYDTVLGAAGIEQTHANGEFVEWDDFGLAAASADRPPTTGLHVAFVAASRDAVHAFRRAGTCSRPRSRGIGLGSFVIASRTRSSTPAIDSPSLAEDDRVAGARRRPGLLRRHWLRASPRG